MVKIRLTRFGAKKAPFYRIVAVDSRSPRNSDYIELVGTYDPMTNPASVRIDAEIAKKWLNCGAQPTDTVKHLLAKQGIIPEFKAPAKTGKTKKKEG